MNGSLQAIEQWAKEGLMRGPFEQNLMEIVEITGDPDLPWRRPEPYGDHR